MWISYEIISDSNIEYQQNLKHFTRKNKRCYVSFIILDIRLLLSRVHYKEMIFCFGSPLKSEGRTYILPKENSILFCGKS